LQYADHYKGTLDQEIKEETASLLNDKKTAQDLNDIELLKCLNCLSYQIEPEHLTELRPLVPTEENALFFLEEMQKALANKIINDLPAYDKAKWGL
jgi:hypothetical protein